MAAGRLKRWLIGGGVLAAAVFGVHLGVLYAVNEVVNVRVEFGSLLDEAASRQKTTTHLRAQRETLPAADFAQLPDVSPFVEVDAFDEDADDWSSYFDAYAGAGGLVFDADGDGRLDVYVAQNNATWVRPTDERSVLVDKPHIRGNGLYLNRGNDADGRPVFKRVSQLMRPGGRFAREELLVENFLVPREGPDDSFDRVGRASACAIAVDLNNDGRLDLVVGNMLPGMLWSHPKTQRVQGQFVRPVGREAVNSKTPLSAQGLYFLKDYEPRDDTGEVRPSSRGPQGEPYGANSVFLNLGDHDGDGLPEWRDASRELGLEGRRNTMALVAADFDLDGDVDVFEANIMDMDLWPGGATELAGAANQLYLNQLAETGRLTFVERAAEWGVDGVYGPDYPQPDYYRLRRLPVLPDVYSVALHRFEKYKPEFLEIGGRRSEPAEISWAAVAQDVNGDNYPDLWVANDLGLLRLYVNQGGRRFALSEEQPRARLFGYWMSLSAADFDGDLHEDLFAGNMGGATMNLSLPIPDMFSLFTPDMSSATLVPQFFGQHTRSMHALFDGAQGFRRELPHKVRHSAVLPPDTSLPNNLRNFVVVRADAVPFDRDSLDPYEFAWGSTIVDVQNDGRPDLYWVGCLNGRGGGIFPIMGTGPGRLLVNATRRPGATRFVDLTAEHHVFNIQELRYDKLAAEGYVYRKSPLQNWGKRSVVYSHDVSVWGFQGPGIVERITNHDLTQTAENGRAAVAADLNGDGFADLLVRNMGGYDSRSSKATNLKARVGGRVEVIPAHDGNFPSPTNYEPGSTRVFLNTYRGAGWIKVQLLDDAAGSYNRDAVGAEVRVNGRYLRVVRSGEGGFISNAFAPLLFGLGQETATHVRVRWPDRAGTVTEAELPGYSGGVLTLSKTRGVVAWRPAGGRG